MDGISGAVVGHLFFFAHVLENLMHLRKAVGVGGDFLAVIIGLTNITAHRERHQTSHLDKSDLSRLPLDRIAIQVKTIGHHKRP